MSPLIALYVLLHLALCTAVGWLLMLPQSPAWRVVLGVIQFGTLWNLAGLIWLGYNDVWPGEPVITGGFCLALLGAMFFKRPLMTRKAQS